MNQNIGFLNIKLFECVLLGKSSRNAMLFTSGGSLLFTQPIKACLGVMFLAESSSTSIIGMLIWYFRMRVHIRPRMSFRLPLTMSLASKKIQKSKTKRYGFTLLQDCLKALDS